LGMRTVAFVGSWSMAFAKDGDHGAIFRLAYISIAFSILA
jgi:hypothetical protein